MIVEEQGIGFRTGVRFPSAPLFKNRVNAGKASVYAVFSWFEGVRTGSQKVIKNPCFPGKYHTKYHTKKEPEKPDSARVSGPLQRAKYHTDSQKTADRNIKAGKA